MKISFVVGLILAFGMNEANSFVFHLLEDQYAVSAQPYECWGAESDPLEGLTLGHAQSLQQILESITAREQITASIEILPYHPGTIELRDAPEGDGTFALSDSVDGNVELERPDMGQSDPRQQHAGEEGFRRVTVLTHLFRHEGGRRSDHPFVTLRGNVYTRSVGAEFHIDDVFDMLSQVRFGTGGELNLVEEFNLHIQRIHLGDMVIDFANNTHMEMTLGGPNSRSAITDRFSMRLAFPDENVIITPAVSIQAGSGQTASVQASLLLEANLHSFHIEVGANGASTEDEDILGGHVALRGTEGNVTVKAEVKSETHQTHPTGGAPVVVSDRVSGTATIEVDVDHTIITGSVSGEVRNSHSDGESDEVSAQVTGSLTVRFPDHVELGGRISYGVLLDSNYSSARYPSSLPPSGVAGDGHISIPVEAGHHGEESHITIKAGGSELTGEGHIEVGVGGSF